MQYIKPKLVAALNWGDQHSTKLLLGCLLLAFALRAWGLNYGLPYIYHPDETVAVTKAQTMLKTGDLNPHFSHWPSLLFYINMAAYSLHFLIGKLFGIFNTVTDIPSPKMVAMGSGMITMPSIWLLSRSITLGAGLGVVLLAFLSGRALTGKTAVGVVAGLLLAISPTNVAQSRYIAPDMLATFFIMLAFFGSVKVWKTGQSRYYLLAGIAAGLSISAKYNAALILTTFFLAHFLRYGLKGFKQSRLYLTPLLSIITFFATTPYAIFDYQTFLEGIQFNAEHYSTGHAGMEGNTLRWYLSFLWRVEGIVFIFAILEIIRGVITRSKVTLFIAVFPIIYFVFINSFIVRNDRTILPIIPFIILLAANLLVWGFEKLSKQEKSYKTMGLIVGLALIVIMAFVVPLQRTIRNNVKLTTVDSRETARVWIADNLPDGSKIAVESYVPYMDRSRFSTKSMYNLKENPIEWYKENEFDYLIFSEGAYGRFFWEPAKYENEMAAYEDLWSQLRLEKMFDDGGYEVRVYAVP